MKPKVQLATAVARKAAPATGGVKREDEPEDSEKLKSRKEQTPLDWHLLFGSDEEKEDDPLENVQSEEHENAEELSEALKKENADLKKENDDLKNENADLWLEVLQLRANKRQCLENVEAESHCT